MQVDDRARSTRLTFTDLMRAWFKFVLDPLAGFLNRLGLMPNTVTLIGLAGTLLGTLLGLGGCWLLSRYQFIDLPKDVFLVNTLPVRIDPLNFLVVALASIVICLVAALSPARRAASLVPVEVIRYE